MKHLSWRRGTRGINKKRTQKLKEGKICPRCNRGKLKACECKGCRGHKKWNVVCNKCHFCNF